MTEIPDWAADMVEANEALGDKVGPCLARHRGDLQGGQRGAQGVGEPACKSAHVQRPAGNGQAQSGPAATGRYTRCTCECRCWSREVGKMVVGRLGSDPCCECDVEGNYGVQACSCRGKHGDQEVLAMADVNGQEFLRWMPVTSPEGQKAIGQRELGDAAEPEAPAEELATDSQCRSSGKSKLKAIRRLETLQSPDTYASRINHFKVSILTAWAILEAFRLAGTTSRARRAATGHSSPSSRGCSGGMRARAVRASL